jgi:hypothetical protein
MVWRMSPLMRGGEAGAGVEQRHGAVDFGDAAGAMVLGAGGARALDAFRQCGGAEGELFGEKGFGTVFRRASMAKAAEAWTGVMRFSGASRGGSSGK